MTRTTMALACALVFGVTLTVMGQTSSIPRTPWGDPDLQVSYTNSNESGLAMERQDQDHRALPSHLEQDHRVVDHR